MLRVLLYIIICVCCCPWAEATQRALVFGLGAQEDPSWGKIHGDNDVELMVSTLSSAGFTDIRTLKNEAATKANMVAAFLGLINRSRAGDVIYIHYSGHGQYMTDLDGDEAGRWTGKHSLYDESWIPYDAYMTRCDKDNGDKHFCDDEVAFYLTQLRKKVGNHGQIYVSIDACHSGDSTHGIDEECCRGIDTPFVIPRQQNIPEAKSLPERWLTISACKPYQLSFEMSDLHVGKLSYALSKLGEKLFGMSNQELQTWLDGFMAAIPSRVTQNPVVSGEK